MDTTDSCTVCKEKWHTTIFEIIPTDSSNTHRDSKRLVLKCTCIVCNKETYETDYYSDKTHFITTKEIDTMNKSAIQSYTL